MATNVTESCRSGSIGVSVTSARKKRRLCNENSNVEETSAKKQKVANWRTEFMSKSLAVTICNIGTCAGQKIASELLDILSDPDLSLTDFRKVVSNYEECTKVMNGTLFDGD